MVYGLLGEKLGHSHSPLIQAQFGITDYRLFPTPPTQVEAFVRGGNLAGLNVTIPYKKAVMPLCATLSDVARRLGNVNTLTFGPNGAIHGHNTDYEGFCHMLARAGITLVGKKVVILGTGGAAQTARAAAQDLGADAVFMISRSGELHYGNLETCSAAQILINATPVGMFPHNEDCPVSLDSFPALEGVADLIYNPLRTNLLLAAQARGIPCAGGLSMLVEQGRAAAESFLMRPIDRMETERAHATVLGKIENIVLIGMPGSGKTTVGKQIAQVLGRELLDTDEMILSDTGRLPSDILRQEGEEAFRAIEADAVARAASRSGVVVATGGGAILREENRAALRRNGRIYWLRRPLAGLAVEDRPLSGDLRALYAVRAPLYAAAANAAIDATADANETAERIVTEFEEHTGAERA